jgi:hypothetical protein
MPVVNDALADASVAFTVAGAHSGSVNASATVGDKIGQYPTVQAFIQAASQQVPRLVDAIQDLHGAIDGAALNNLAAAAYEGDKAVATAGAPLTLQRIQSATQKLRTAADLSEVTTKFEAMMGDPQLRAAARQWCQGQGGGTVLEEVRGALASVDLSHLAAVGQIEGAADTIQQSGHTVPTHTQAVVSHLTSELRQISDSLKRDATRMVSACDQFVAALA